MQNEGNIIIVAAPSGGGKTSLVKTLISRMPLIEVSTSHTTRDIRPGEQEGVDYFFVSKSEFEHKIEHGDFIEHAEVFGNLYGTSKSQIKARLAKGIDVVLDIDWQGAEQIKQHFPNAISVFILPPSLEELNRRLLNRGRDELAVIEQRMQQAKEEMRHYPNFDYLIVNDVFELAAQELMSIVTAHRLECDYQMQKQQKLLSLLLS